MSKFNNIKKYTIAIATATAVLLSACGGTGSCPPDGSNGGKLPTLKLTAPNQYPAGLSSPITAYLTMTNTSSVNANNLYYSIPSETNYTGVAISVANGSVNPCLSIAAHQSCTFPVVIGANANPGSFTVTATPNGATTQSSGLFSKLINKLGLTANNTLSLTANIGLTDLGVNSNSGANGISFLYNNVISADESGDTLISVVGVVNSASAGSFNTINLTDQSGNLLNFTVVSGNSGNGASNLSLGSIVTFLLKIPSSASNSTFNFYAQTLENSELVSQGTIANPITVGSFNSGVLVIQPTNFSLSTPSYESQVITFTNIGNGPISALSIPNPQSPLYQISNNCGSSLAAGASCTYIVGSHAEAGFSGDAGISASYNSGSGVNSVSAQVHYSGADPVAGISVSSGDNPTLNFVSNTESTVKSSQLTLTNTGNVSESNFVFTVPQYFTLASGTSGTPCILSGNTVTTVLNKNSTCTLTLTYTNGTITNGSQTSSLKVDYKYHGFNAPQSSIPLTYQTVLASGLLSVNPSIYSYPNIRANGNMSESKVFIYTNIGTGTASNISATTLLGGAAIFQIIPSSPSDANDCGSNVTTLAPGAQCQVTVQFGPAYAEGNESSPLSASYESMPSTTPVKTDAALSGTVLPALSANIIVSNVSFNPTALGGNGSSQESAFAFESSISPISVTLTYKNIGNDAATHFILSSSLYTFSTNNCNDVTLPINGTCTVTISYTNNTIAVDDEISLGSKYIPLSWSDDSGVYSNMGAQWDNNGTPQNSIFISIFAKPTVTAVMSYESDGVTPITSVNAESDFYVVYTLTGGYNVQNMTYGVNLTNAQGGTPPISAYSPTTCVLSGAQAKCYVKLNAGDVAESQVISYTTTGNVAPNPATSGYFNVTGRFAYVLSQDKIYSFNYNSTTGLLTANDNFSAYGNDSVAIVASKDGNYLYVADQTQSKIKAFAINKVNGALSFIESVATGTSPSYGSLRFDNSGKYLYSSSMGSNTISVFAYNSSNGSLSLLHTVIGGSYPSVITFTPDNKFAYITNSLGVTPPNVAISARVYMYKVESNGNLTALSPESSIQSLSNNPYDLVVDPSGKYLYVTNTGVISAGPQNAEHNVSIFDINQVTGQLSYNAAQSLVNVESAPTSIVMSRDGSYVYVANALSGTISQLSANSVSGNLTPLNQSTVNAGITPSTIVFSPNERFLYSVSQYGNFIQMYTITNGLISPVGSTVATGSSNQSGFIIFN